MFRKLKDLKFDLKMRYQRFKKGYADIDTWNLDGFLEETFRKMLIQFKEEHNGYPPNLTPEKWEEILDRMIFLLGEMNEYTCSKKTDLGSTIKEMKEKYDYMVKCKNEFYDLMKEHHYQLWW